MKAHPHSQVRQELRPAIELNRRALLCDENGQFDRAQSLRDRADELLDERTPEVMHEDLSRRGWCVVIAVVLGSYAACVCVLAGAIRFIHWLTQQ
jgi:hypothetical protein